MKVFISWSGDVSHKVACVWRDWLPFVIQAVDPYVSSKDIDKGARWSEDIATELEASSYGIICVTASNPSAPWLNFEAGALSKSFDKSRVSPFLLGLNRSDVPAGPLVQFQSTIFERQDVLKLVQGINAQCDESPLDEPRVVQMFEVMWPKLEKNLAALQDEAAQPGADGDKTAPAVRGEAEILGELLELVRSQQRVLASPDILLPAGYLREVMGQAGSLASISPETFYELAVYFEELQGVAFMSDADSRVLKLIQQLETPIRYLEERADKARGRNPEMRETPERARRRREKIRGLELRLEREKETGSKDQPPLE